MTIPRARHRLQFGTRVEEIFAKKVKGGRAAENER
jgi:hypothetical protein